MIKPTFAPASVIIPCFCCADTISRAVASVFAQSWPPAEVILIDDNSSDSTLDELYRIRSLYSQDRVHVYHLPKNSGPGTARNFGWDIATQPYIAFLDADDAWHCQKIEIQLGWMLTHPAVMLTGHACRVLDVNQKHELYSKIDTTYIDFLPVHRKQLLISNQFPTPSIILNKRLSNRFMDGNKYSEDYFLWCNILLDGNLCYRSRLPLVFLFKEKFGDTGLTGNLWLMETGEMACYKNLYKCRKISRSEYLLHAALSMIKFAKRSLYVALRHYSYGITNASATK